MLICRIGDATGYAEFWNMLVLMYRSEIVIITARVFALRLGTRLPAGSSIPQLNRAFLPILNSNSEQRGR
jgi:hypothetical protein